MVSYTIRIPPISSQIVAAKALSANKRDVRNRFREYAIAEAKLFRRQTFWRKTLMKLTSKLKLISKPQLVFHFWLKVDSDVVEASS